MKNYLISIFAFWLALTVSNVTETQGQIDSQDQVARAPNIVVIMADDHGQWASEVYGNRDLHTPNMVWLAKHGVTFSQAYAVSPVCSPSRASLFTGRMPSQHGVHDFLSESAKFDHGWLANETFLGELLQGVGYKTALVGKWHATTNSARVQRGFDYWFSYDVAPAGWSNQYQHRGGVHFSDQGDSLTLDGFQSQRLTDKAIDFMDHRSDEPFFLFLGLVDTHAPFEGQPERLVAPFRNKNLQEVPNGAGSHLPARSAANKIPADHKEQLAQYYAGVEMMDLQIGRIIDYLEAQNMLENTLIVYTSDHGHMNGHHGLYGKGNATRPQNFYQENILVPLTLTWPRGIPKERRISQAVSTCDLHSTLLEAAGVVLADTLKEAINSPGKSVWPLLKNPSTNWGEYKFCELGNARMIANEKFKYVQRLAPIVDGFGDEFYDLTMDASERQNVLKHPAYKEQVSQLKLLLEQFFQKFQDPQHSGANLQSQLPANANEQWRQQ